MFLVARVPNDTSVRTRADPSASWALSMESEWLTRKRRIDPLLDAAGWPVRREGNAAFRTEEDESAHGPADYALWLDGRVVGTTTSGTSGTAPAG
jgi:predicted type IV restriction endonuclease